MRLIEQRAGLAPRALLVAPVRELARHDGKRIRADLRIAQHLDRVARGLQGFLQVAMAHGDDDPPWSLSISEDENGGTRTGSSASSTCRRRNGRFASYLALPVRQPSAYVSRATCAYGTGLTIARTSSCLCGSTVVFLVPPLSSPQTKRHFVADLDVRIDDAERQHRALVVAVAREHRRADDLAACCTILSNDDDA